MTTAFANAIGIRKCGDARSPRLPTQRDAGHAIAASANATAPISRPDITAPATRNAFRLAVVTPLGRSPSRTCRSPSTHPRTRAGHQGLAETKSCFPLDGKPACLPSSPEPPASKGTQRANPRKNADSWVETLPSQAETTRGAMPSRKPGRPISSTHANTSLGRLISATKLPASANSDRRFVLDASSSVSPFRGSIIGIIDRLVTAGRGLVSPATRPVREDGVAL